MVIVTFPSSVGTSISAPSKASVSDTDTSTCTSSPRRSKIGCDCTCTVRYTSPPSSAPARRIFCPLRIPLGIVTSSRRAWPSSCSITGFFAPRKTSSSVTSRVASAAGLALGVPAARRLLPGAGAARTAEEVLPVDPAALVGLVHLVVARALLRVAQDLVGLIDLLEFLFRAGGLVYVGVGLARQALVGAADRLGVRRPLDPEGPVVVLELHRRARPPRRRPASRLPSDAHAGRTQHLVADEVSALHFCDHRAGGMLRRCDHLHRLVVAGVEEPAGRIKRPHPHVRQQIEDLAVGHADAFNDGRGGGALPAVLQCALDVVHYREDHREHGAARPLHRVLSRPRRLLLVVL